MRPMRTLLAMLAVLGGLIPAVAHSTTTTPTIRAGVGIADATWHVGVGSGQYSAKNPNALNLATGGDIDPHNHSNVQSKSYGVQSRLTYRALVVEGTNGKRVALVKSDSYLAQDILQRRVAQILAKGTSGIGYEQIMLTASHNHSSPYYFSPAWGVWLFQDVFEIRVFEYHARQMALAIERAAADLRPARMGATTIRHTIYKGQIAGATITDDGSPGGYPETFHEGWTGKGGHGDFDVTVMRLDDVTNPEAPAPLAVWVNHGQHPESLDGYDLITADFLAPLERFVEREIGAPLVFSQGDVGSAEGPYFRDNNETLPDGVRRAWAHVGHAQTERGARYLADSIIEAWNKIGAGEPSVRVPLTTDFPVGYVNGFVPGPVSHPYPSVSNCRTESTVEGNPGSPILGLPDCERAGSNDASNMLWENLKMHGLPIPDHYDAPSHAAVEENNRVRLQAFRLGEVLVASCACEAQMDIILNFESRADNVEGNIFDGYDWGQYCTQNADTTWTCPRPGVRDVENPTATITISDLRYRHMRAQVHNDAKGWDKVENAIAANAEPADFSKIWGNFTKTELDSETGYALTVGVGHAGDYNGYTVSYREYMSRDHYRKALTCCGPHTADYMSTRMVAMGAALRTNDWTLAAEPLEPLAQADEARQTALAVALGAASSAAYDAWLAALPNDKGPAAIVTQPPASIERFSAATFTWRGGSNAVDNPSASVERLVDGTWTPFADQTGEVQTMIKFPKGAQGVVDTYTGNQEWLWTANFEAFDATPQQGHPMVQTPLGTYRFVVEGQIRQGNANVPYRFESASFDVTPWDGITADSLVTNADGSVSFRVADVYPRSYAGSPFRYIRDDGNQVLCRTCSFRPWAATGTVTSATVTVVRDGGAVDLVPATVDGNGVWTAATALASGDVASIAAGGIVDAFGEINGAEYAFP